MASYIRLKCFAKQQEKVNSLSLGLIPFIFLAIPVTEIVVFILVGSQIGVLATIALVILTAIAGSMLLRWQGLSALSRIQSELAADRVPGKEMVQGVMILLAGFLLLTPGFVTDTLGLLLFIPKVRDAAWHFLSKRANIRTFGGRGFAAGFGAGEQPSHQTGPVVIELDEDEFKRQADPSSPWATGEQESKTRH